MALTKFQKFGAAASLSLAAIFGAAEAQALEARQCLPMAEMNAALRAEGQRTMIIGDRMAIVDDASRTLGGRIDRFVNTVTSNADGSVGYQLEGNLPRAQASTEVCVAAKLTNIRLFDARRPGVPAGARLGGAFDQALVDHDQRAIRPMLQADTVAYNPDGSSRLGRPLTIIGKVENKTGAILVTLEDTRPQRLALLSDTEYTPVALERLNAPVQLAAHRPN